ncbi:hypothetical protein K435DRAFT_778935, partial [Dendrothele bispora CBS 962.96]
KCTLGTRILLSLPVSLGHAGQCLMITEKFDEVIFVFWGTFLERLLMRMIFI